MNVFRNCGHYSKNFLVLFVFDFVLSLWVCSDYWQSVKCFVFSWSELVYYCFVLQYFQKMFVRDYDPTIEDSYIQHTQIDGQHCILDGMFTYIHTIYMYIYVYFHPAVRDIRSIIITFFGLYCTKKTLIIAILTKKSLSICFAIAPLVFIALRVHLKENIIF